MQFLYSVASILALSPAALAAVRKVQLFASSDNADVNDYGVSSVHEGAGVNYLFLAAPGVAETVNYDDEKYILYLENSVGEQVFSISQGQGFLQYGESSVRVDIAEDGTVSFDGSDSVVAAKNVNDPYNRSEQDYFLVTQGGDGAIPVKIVAKFVDSEEASSSAEEEAPASSAEPTEAPSSSAAEEPEVSEAPSSSAASSVAAVSSFEGSANVVGAGSFVAAAAAVAGLMF
ncbi:Cell wall protein PGA31 [Candida viswanathii]|uniref:Cell wall protein PGA31 n=1 Tax=Candida viswanathii TaxID=5486 RepID=A0A367Y207_9ASCO|nr:Cell wall protein PGA31 [Candida viswanathii]